MVKELRIQEVNKQISQEVAHLEHLKLKMELIKCTAQIAQNERKEPLSHDIAIRSGGYYMFEDTESAQRRDSMESLDDEKTSCDASRVVSFKLPESDESTDLSEKPSALKRISTKFLTLVIQRMHRLSKNYSFIYKMLAHEKKSLKESMSPLHDPGLSV